MLAYRYFMPNGLASNQVPISCHCDKKVRSPRLAKSLKGVLNLDMRSSDRGLVDCELERLRKQTQTAHVPALGNKKGDDPQHQ